MSDHPLTPQTDSEPGATAAPEDGATARAARRSVIVRRVLWALLSLVMVGYALFGTVSTVHYEYNAFLQKVFRIVNSERILSIWQYQTRHLPDLDWQSRIEVLFAGALIAFLVSCVGAFWYALGSVTPGPPTRLQPPAGGEPRRTD